MKYNWNPIYDALADVLTHLIDLQKHPENLDKQQIEGVEYEIQKLFVRVEALKNSVRD
jgi:hypothetical protein